MWNVITFICAFFVVGMLWSLGVILIEGLSHHFRAICLTIGGAVALTYGIWQLNPYVDWNTIVGYAFVFAFAFGIVAWIWGAIGKLQRLSPQLKSPATKPPQPFVSDLAGISDLNTCIDLCVVHADYGIGYVRRVFDDRLIVRFPDRQQEERVVPPAKLRSYWGGRRVFHAKFGLGEVLHATGDKLTIAFDRAGEKCVSDSFVEEA